MIASVTINGATRNRVTTRPTNAPDSPQAAVPTRKPAATVHGGASSPPSCFMPNAPMTADSAIRLPTDRSMPAVIITIVIPMAMIAITTMRSTMASRLEGWRKEERSESEGVTIFVEAYSG